MAGHPMLGICVGMQIFLDVSEKFGEHKGLGILPGRERRIPEVDAAGRPHKVPHIGWNSLVPPGGRPTGRTRHSRT
jgi:glutamine amidotransferase